MSTARNPGFRYCDNCHQLKPVDAFEWHDLSRAIKRNICRGCEKKRLAVTIASEETAATAKRARELLRSLNGPPKENVSSVATLCNGLYDLEGGIQGFCQVWHEQFHEAIDRNPGSKTVLDFCRGMANLLIRANEEQGARSDLDEMTDGQLMEEVKRLIKQELWVQAPEDVFFEGEEKETA